MQRLFFGLFFEEKQARCLVADIPASAELRVVPRNQIHCTVRWLGDVDLPTADAKASLGRLAAQTPQLSLRADRIDPFPPGRPRLLAAMLEPDSALLSFTEQLDGLLGQFLPEGRGRPFSPHCTVARYRDGVRPWSPKRIDCRLTANALTLIRSQLLPDGPQYTTEASFPFYG